VLYDENRFLIRRAGLMFDGTDDDDSFEGVAALVGRNLKSKPPNLPFEERDFSFAINAKPTKVRRLEILALCESSPAR
jgi:hypothetical protein